MQDVIRGETWVKSAWVLFVSYLTTAHASAIFHDKAFKNAPKYEY